MNQRTVVSCSGEGWLDLLGCVIFPLTPALSLGREGGNISSADARLSVVWRAQTQLASPGFSHTRNQKRVRKGRWLVPVDDRWLRGAKEGFGRNPRHLCTSAEVVFRSVGEIRAV